MLKSEVLANLVKPTGNKRDDVSANETTLHFRERAIDVGVISQHLHRKTTIQIGELTQDYCAPARPRELRRLQ